MARLRQCLHGHEPLGKFRLGNCKYLSIRRDQAQSGAEIKILKQTPNPPGVSDGTPGHRRCSQQGPRLEPQDVGAPPPGPQTILHTDGYVYIHCHGRNENLHRARCFSRPGGGGVKRGGGGGGVKHGGGGGRGVKRGGGGGGGVKRGGGGDGGIKRGGGGGGVK